MDEVLLSPCNVYCGNCIMHKKSKCLGCAAQSKKAKAKGEVFCDIYSCAVDKKLVACSDCESYSCEKYDKGIFAKSYIEWLREKLKE